MRKHFQDELEKLNKEVLTMADLVETALKKSLRALKTNDTGLAEEVRKEDMAIDLLQYRIDDSAAMLIATQQPVAHDLRELVSIFKITNNLERAGDHATHLAKLVLKIEDSGEYDPIKGLERMAELCLSSIRASVDAWVKRSADLAREASKLDLKIDAEKKNLDKELFKLMKNNPEDIRIASRMLACCANLERLGDHMTNICEAVIFMQEGHHEIV